MSQIVGTFGIDPLPSGVEPWSIVAVLGTWLGAGLVAPFRSALAAFSVLALLAIMPARCRGWVAAGLLGLSVVGGLLVARWWTEASGIPDDRRIAIDEVAGLLIALLPVLRSRPAVLALVTVLFVAVDRIKPWPVSAVESADLPWSLGVMLDDVTGGWSSPARWRSLSRSTAGTAMAANRATRRRTASLLTFDYVIAGAQAASARHCMLSGNDDRW